MRTEYISSGNKFRNFLKTVLHTELQSEKREGLGWVSSVISNYWRPSVCYIFSLSRRRRRLHSAGEKKIKRPVIIEKKKKNHHTVYGI